MRKSSPYLILSLLILLFLVPIAHWAVSNMALDTSIDKIMGTDNRSKATYDKFNEAFKQKSVLIAIVKVPDLFSNQGAKNLYRISHTFTQIEGLKDIKSLTHSSRPVKKGFSFDISKMIVLENFLTLDKKSTAQWVQLKSFTTKYPMTKNLLVSEDGQYAVIMAVMNQEISTLAAKVEIRDKVKAVFAPFKNEGLEIMLLSEAFLTVEFHDLVNKFLFSYISLSLIAACLIILIIFKSAKITLIMLFYQLGGLMIFPVIFYFNKADINVYTLIIIPLISAIQLTFITHFYAVFLKNTKNNTDFKQSLKLSLNQVIKPSIIAFLTSGLGLLSLCSSNLDILVNVGKVGIQSLTAIFVLTFLPAFIYSYKATLVDGEDLQNQKEIKTSIAINRPKTILFVFVALSLLSLLMLPRLEVDIRTKEFLQKNSDTREAIDAIDKYFGGTNIIQLNIHTNGPLSIQDHETLKYLHKLREQVLSIEGVNDAYTYSQLYSTLHQLFLGDNFSTGETLPDRPQSQMYSNLMNNLNFPFQHILQNKELNQTLFIFRTTDLPSKDILKIVKRVLALSEIGKPELIQVKVNDGLQSILESDRNIVNSQLKSISWSLFAIFCLLTIIWRTWIYSSSAVIANFVPLLILFASMPLLKTSLNSINIMLAPLILSIAIDDAIHFISTYRSKVQLHPQAEALSITIQEKVRPILCTSLILFFSMILFCLAPFPPVQEFGYLGALTIVLAFLTTMFLLPCLLYLRKNSDLRRHTSKHPTEPNI